MSEEKQKVIMVVAGTIEAELISAIRDERNLIEAKIEALHVEFQERHKQAVEAYKCRDRELVNRLNEVLELPQDQPLQLVDDYLADHGVAFIHVLPMAEKKGPSAGDEVSEETDDNPLH